MSLWWWKKYRKQQCEATQAPKSPKVMFGGHSLQIADGADRSAAYVKLNDGSSVHIAPCINKIFNNNLEHDSTERLRRVRGEGRCPGPRVAPPPADAVAPGTPFATLVTYNSPSKGKCTSAGIFSLLKCTLEGTAIAHPSAMGLKHTQGAKPSGEFLPPPG